MIDRIGLVHLAVLMCGLFLMTEIAVSAERRSQRSPLPQAARISREN